MNTERDLFGLGAFILLFTLVCALIAGGGYLIVQDSHFQRECIAAGKSYEDGDCLNK